MLPREALRLALHRDFRHEAVAVAIDGRDGEHAAAALVAHDAIACGDVAVDFDVIPALRMADVVDRDVVMLAPEERHGVEPFAAAEHVERGRLSLALCDDPVLDANR